jgi:hypothetical protein
MAEQQEQELTEAEKTKIKEWLRLNEAVRPCPICGFNEWGLADRLTQLPLYFRAGTAMSLGVGYPAVVVVCGRCAYFRFHSAIKIGIAPTDEEIARLKEAKNG